MPVTLGGRRRLAAIIMVLILFIYFLKHLFQGMRVCMHRCALEQGEGQRERGREKGGERDKRDRILSRHYTPCEPNEGLILMTLRS